MSTKRKTRSQPEPASIEDELKAGVETSRKRIKTRALTRKFRALGEALFDCGGAVGKAKTLLDETVASARDETLEHLADIQRLMNIEMEELKDKAGLRACCICGATDDAPVRRLAEGDPTILGFPSLSDLPPINNDRWRQCKCATSVLCPACFGRTRISVKSTTGRLYDMVRCPSCRSDRLFEVPQVEVAIWDCDPRIVPRDDPAIARVPIVLRGGACTPILEPTGRCDCHPDARRSAPRQRPRTPPYRPSSPDYSRFDEPTDRQRQLLERNVQNAVRDSPGVSRQWIQSTLGISSEQFDEVIEFLCDEASIFMEDDRLYTVV